jgi:DNA-binding MarR family transcriptional regulator
MEKLDEIFFYTLEKSIKVYRKFAQTQITNKGFDITIDQWLVLKTLEENKQISQNQVADLVFKDVASLTRIIELLVKKKYVKRKINNSDRRKFELEITAAGNAIIKKIYPIVFENREKALQDLQKEELVALKLQLEKIINNCK